MAKKIVLIVCGAVALLISLPLLVGGIVLLAIGGRSGTLQSGFHQVSTSSVALVADPSEIRGNGDAALKIGGASLQVAGRGSGRPMFLGVGPASQVTDYLSGTSYDSVSRIEFSPFRLSTTHVEGNGQPAAPSDQSFWVAEATGTAPELSWKVTGGDYLIVAMNEDASPGVAFDARVGLTAGVLFDTALGFTIAGMVLLLLGAALLIWGIVTKRAPPVAPPGYAYPYPYPAPGYQWQAGQPPPYPGGYGQEMPGAAAPGPPPPGPAGPGTADPDPPPGPATPSGPTGPGVPPGSTGPSAPPDQGWPGSSGRPDGPDRSGDGTL